MDEALPEALTIVENPTGAQCTAFVQAWGSLPIDRKMNLFANDPEGFERMAVYPDGSHGLFALSDSRQC